MFLQKFGKVCYQKITFMPSVIISVIPLLSSLLHLHNRSGSFPHSTSHHLSTQPHEPLFLPIPPYSPSAFSLSLPNHYHPHQIPPAMSMIFCASTSKSLPPLQLNQDYRSQSGFRNDRPSKKTSCTFSLITINLRQSDQERFILKMVHWIGIIQRLIRTDNVVHTLERVQSERHVILWFSRKHVFVSQLQKRFFVFLILRFQVVLSGSIFLKAFLEIRQVDSS